MRFIRQSFGTDAALPNSQRSNDEKQVLHHSSCSHEYRVSDAYFDTMSRMQAAVSRRDFEEAARLVHENLRYIPGLVKEWCSDYGSFAIGMIPALQQGGTVLALVGDDEGLTWMSEIIASMPELEPWTEEIQRHQLDRQLFKAILEAVATQPNCLQTEVKGLIGEVDGRRVANLISYLDKAKKIVRVKAGRTYRLLPSDSPDIPAPPQKRIIKSHRTDQKPPRLREIDVSSLNYVPLPRAPERWEEEQTGRERAMISEAKDPFEVRDSNWRIATVEKIPPSQRPDTAFRQMYPTDSGIVMIDDLGKADGLGQIEAAALRYDRAGELAVKKRLQHGVSRVGVHPIGRGLIAMSRDCIVHAYDDQCDPMLETSLIDAPEILALRKRFDIPDDQLKNHIRCVALSRDANRYLFTTVDEAWCVDIGGRGLWGYQAASQGRLDTGRHAKQRIRDKHRHRPCAHPHGPVIPNHPGDPKTALLGSRQAMASRPQPGRPRGQR